MIIKALIAGAIVGGIGLVLGAALWFASKTFAVKQDERIEKITECLPGANCGGCGYAGCSNYASEIITNGAPINLCGALTADGLEKISQIIGVGAELKEKTVAFVKCSGGNDVANKKYQYYGMSDCAAATRLLQGHMMCTYGCVGFGSCATVCPVGAVSIINGVAKVDADSCIGCKACVNVCPKNVIEIIPASAKIAVACSSSDKGASTRKNCLSGCIGCKKCEKSCEAGAITVTDNVARIDASKCTACGKCQELCPVKIIKVRV